MYQEVTLSSIRYLIGDVTESFKFQKTYQIHLTPVTLPHLPKGVFGLIEFKMDGQPTFQQQPFYMSYGDAVSGACESREITFLIRLGKALEKKFSSQGCQVATIQLPKAFGFSGTRYGFRQTKDLFPELA